MAEQKKRTTPFVPPKSFKEAGQRLVRAVGAWGERQARRMSPETFAAADKRKKEEEAKTLAAQQERVRSQQLSEEVNRMLGAAQTIQEPGLVSGPATPAAPAVAPAPQTGVLAAPIASARATQTEKMRERLRMQGFTEAEIQELHPGP